MPILYPAVIARISIAGCRRSLVGAPSDPVQEISLAKLRTLSFSALVFLKLENSLKS